MKIYIAPSRRKSSEALVKGKGTVSQ